ncbi:MAG: MFS transporter [Candidatus ainarchaeum sp.]|nr:MFS transporter [Candidatus ainarchaeum sp.]
MIFKQSKNQIKRDFSFSVKDGVFWVLMNSIAIVFLVPYLISLGANSFQIGLLNSFPLFITSFLVLISYKILKRFKSKKHAVVIFLTLQALMWIPLAMAYFFFSNSITIWIVILIYTIITALGTVIHPIYMDWIRKLFPTKQMGFYIAKKNIILEFVSIFPIFLIGYILDVIFKSDTFIGYSIIFIFAGIFRFFSTRFLNRMSETEDKEDILKLVKEKQKISLLKSFKDEVIKDKSFLKFLIFIILSYIGIHLATSYVSYFILHLLNYSSMEYVIWKISFILGTVLSLSYWGYVSDNYSPVKVLKISALFLPLFLIIPAFFYSNYSLMVFSIFVAGVIFGAFNLGVLDYLYKNIKKDLIGHSSYFLIIQASSIFVGTLLGSGIIYFATKFYYSEFKALIFLFIFTIFFRFIAFFYSLKLEKLERRDLRFFKYVIFQRPVLYGLLQFTHLSHEEKKLLLDLKFKSEFKKIKSKLFNQKKQ